MKTARLIIVALCTIMAVSSCRSRKDLTRPDGSAAMLEHAVDIINSHRQTADCLTARMNTSTVVNGKKISIGGTLKMKRDDVIQVSLVMLGIMEVARMELTQDYMMVVIRRGNKYVKVKYDDVPALQEAGVDFFTFQSLFWDELFLPGDKGAAPQADKFSRSLADGNVRLSNSDSGIATLTFLADMVRGMVCETSVSAIGKDETPILQWQYSDYEKVDKHDFPTKMKVRINGSKPVEATFTFSNIKQDGGWETRTRLSGKYSEIPLESIMGKLLSPSF